MNEQISLSSLKIKPNTYYDIVKILQRNNLPATIGGVAELGIAGIYNFDISPVVFSANELSSLLKALKSKDCYLTITKQEFEDLDFEILYDGKAVKQQIYDVLENCYALKNGKVDEKVDNIEIGW